MTRYTRHHLPAARPGLDCPPRASRVLPLIGEFRGRVPHLTETRGAP